MRADAMLLIHCFFRPSLSKPILERIRKKGRTTEFTILEEKIKPLLKSVAGSVISRVEMSDDESDVEEVETVNEDSFIYIHQTFKINW